MYLNNCHGNYTVYFFSFDWPIFHFPFLCERTKDYQSTNQHAQLPTFSKWNWSMLP